MCTGGEGRRQGESTSISNKNWIRDVYWRRNDAFGTHLAHLYAVPAQSYHFQGICEIQWNSIRFNGLVYNCYQNEWNANISYANHWISFEFHWISLNFMYSLKKIALRRHIVPGGVREDLHQYLIRVEQGMCTEGEMGALERIYINIR